MALSPEQQARLKTAATQSALTELETGFPAEVIIAQWALESGWGASQPGNNCFGHKAPVTLRDNRRRQLLTTKEWFNQPELQRFLALGDLRTAIEDTNMAPRGGRRRYTVKDWFMKYGSLSEIFSIHARKLQTGRYQPAWDLFRSDRDPIELGRGIHRAGYATAPDYGDQLARLMQRQDVRDALRIARAESAPAPETGSSLALPAPRRTARTAAKKSTARKKSASPKKAAATVAKKPAARKR